MMSDDMQHTSAPPPPRCAAVHRVARGRLVAVILLSATYFVAGQPNTSTPSGPNVPVVTPLVFEVSGVETPYTLGEVAQGERVTFPCVVKNATSTAVTVGPFATSCECFSVELLSSIIPANEEITGRIILDLAKEPQFQGGLMLFAEATLSGAQRPFTIRLTVNVR